MDFLPYIDNSGVGIDHWFRKIKNQTRPKLMDAIRVPSVRHLHDFTVSSCPVYSRLFKRTKLAGQPRRVPS